MGVRNVYKVGTNFLSSALSIEEGLEQGDALYTSGLYNCIAIVAYNGAIAFLCHLNTALVSGYEEACRVRDWLRAQTGVTRFMHSLGKAYMDRTNGFALGLAATYERVFGASHGLPGPSAALDWDAKGGHLRLTPSDDETTITDNGYGRAMPTHWGRPADNDSCALM
jgi:hypothetical protein